MKDKFADIDSVVGFIFLDDNEFRQVKLVNSAITSSNDELSIQSKIGEVLRLGRENEIKTVEFEDGTSYQIKIISIINPVKKIESLAIKPFGSPVILNDFILAATDNYSNYISNIENGLEIKHAYGTSARDIYVGGIQSFGWDASKLGSFCPQKLLFSKDCSKEGYSVWFLTYSNLNNYPNPKTNWLDYINGDFDIVKEYWKKLDSRFYDDKDIRITFARQKDGKYIYIGIFQVKETDLENKCKTYYRIEGNYPC